MEPDMGVKWYIHPTTVRNHENIDLPLEINALP